MFKGLSNLANLGSILKQAQQMGSRMQALNEELKTRRATGASGGGMVTVEVNGLGEVLSCRIDQPILGELDRELLEDLVPAAVNQALAKAREMHQEAMQSMTAGMNIPGLEGMLGQVANELEGRKPETVLSESVTRLVEEFAKLPGVGKKSAERLAYHVLRVHKSEALALADAIRAVKENVRYCKNCFNLAEAEECSICLDAKRDQTMLCVVEQVRDLMALEQAGSYRGLYHVLLGRIAPLDGIGADQLTIEQLITRVRAGVFREVIMGTNPTLEGDGTALYISNLLASEPVEITRLARGITTGSVLEFANKEILADALAGRQKF